MIPPRCAAVLFACCLIVGRVAAQTPTPSGPPMAASPFADDDRAARVAERYKAMLSANPAEGMALDRLWKMYEERNASATLIDDYRRATDVSDKPADALVYGHLLKRAGRLDEAAGSYERAARLDPASPLPFVAQADLAIVRSHPADAAASLETAIGKIPAADRRRADWLLKLGDAWLAAGQPLKASEAWETLIAADPSNLTLRKQLAANYEKNGLPERAIVHYDYLQQHADPAGRASALRELGRLHETRGEFDAARDALERGLALTARDNWLYGELQTRLIRLYQRAGKASELEARWRAAVEQTPRDLGGYLRLVALAEAQGDPAAARAWLEKVVTLSPRDGVNTIKLARLLAEAGENERAAALYNAALKLRPGDLDLILTLADLDLQRGQPADAVARVESRIAQNPADESVSVPALQFFLSHRLDDAAQRLLAAAVARQPSTPEPSLALAKFYFGHGRAADALAVLDRLVHQPGDAATRAQRWVAAAGCYKDNGRSDEALRCWQEAAGLQPDSGAALVAVGELLLAKGDLVGGTAQMERAIAATPAGPDREEIDRKLFQALLDRSAPKDIVPAAPVPSSVSPPGGEGHVTNEPDRPLVRYLAGMEKAAREQSSATGYLRLARWLQWSHHPHDAAQAADAALALEPRNVPAREVLADSAVALHNHRAAIRRLSEIAALDPGRKPEATKRIADLLLEDGEYDGAMALLDRRAQETPGSVEVLADLALAQQRADRWFDALATWEQAYALPHLTPAQRGNLRQSMVSAYEHLGQFPRAAELLQAAIDGQEDLAARQDLFRELVAFCQSHSLGSWLEGVYKARLAAQPQDYFTMTALAELRKAAGDPQAAYRLLDQAYYSSPDPAAALRTLVTEAEALGDNEEAVAHQRRLVGFAGQANPENLEKLAALEEANLDDAAAVRIWEQVAARFSRDTSALGAAADYFEKVHRIDRAQALSSRIAALDPGDFRRLFQLAQLDLQLGDSAGARTSLETILARTRTETPDDPLILPQELDPSTEPAELMLAAGRGPARPATGTIDPSAADGGERSIRLKAIGQLSRIFFAGGDAAGAEDRRRWLERWRAAASAGARSEPLAAFFHAGQKDAVHDLTASWLNKPDPENLERLEKTFLLAGLRMENYAPLARWVWSTDAEGGERASQLIETLGYFLTTGGRPSPGMVPQLFPAEIKSRALLWQIASGVFAEKRWYAEAVDLGERAIALPGGSIASEAFQLAQWEVDVGRIDAARDILRRAVDEGDGTAFDATANNAVFADLRAYYFLLPAGERTGFVTGYLQRAQTRRDKVVHATLAAILLHGLQGDEPAACRGLDLVVEMRLLDGREGGDSADVRRWNYLYACGAQLQAWNLDKLAAHIWRRGLDTASAFDKHDPEVRNLLGEIRLHQLVAEVTTASDPQEARERVTEYLREGPPIIAMASAASVLMNVGQYAAAVQIYERLRREVPAEPEYPRGLLLAEEAEGDKTSVQGVLESMLDDGPPAGPLASRLEILTKRVSLLEESGDTDGACRLLLAARKVLPRSPVVLRPLAQILERLKRFDDAAAIWRVASESDHSVSLVEALASVELARGQREAAFVLARDAQDPVSESEQAWWFGRRVGLYLAAGRPREAVELARQWVTDGKTAGLTEAGSSLAMQGQRPAARELFTMAARNARDPLVRFQMQQALVQFVYTERDVPMDDFLREMRRLERFANAVPGQRQQYLQDRYTFAVARGATEWLENELQREWSEGQGEVAAGERLVDLYFETKRWDALQRLVAAVDARPNLPEQTLASLETKLVKAGRAAWALPVAERLCRRFPLNAEYTLTRARALWQAGLHEEAVRVLGVLDAGTVFREDHTGRAALVYLEFGERARAIASLEQTVALDPLAVRSVSLHCRLAALYVEDKRMDEAYRLLTVAYRNPSQTDLGTLVDYLQSAGRLEVNASGELPGGELPLTFLRRAQLLAAVYDRLHRTGRGQEAFRLAAAHPELLPAVPGLAATLRRNAVPEQVAALATLVESAISQAEGGSVKALQSELAKLYVRRAGLLSANQPPQTGEALNFLTQAYELAPDDFLVARPLAFAFRAQHQDARANAVLAPFLSADALPTERAAARQVLGMK